MNVLDIRTILIGFVVSDFICATVIGSLWLQQRGNFPGLFLWVVNFILQTVSLLLIALRGVVPDFLSIIGGNTMNIAGAILLLIGLERYLGRKGPQIHNWIMLAVFAAVHTYFSTVRPNLAVRDINASAAFLFISAQCAWLLLRRAEARLRHAAKSAGIVFGAFVLVSIVRIAGSLILATGNDYLQSGSFDASFLLAYQMLSIALTFSLFLMVSRRQSEALDEDIARRKRAEEELILSEKKFSAVFHSIPDAVVLISAKEGAILEVNDNFSRIIGYSRDEALGRTTLDLGLWGNPADRDTFVAQLQSQAHPRNIEMEFRKKSGESIIGWVSGEILHLQQGVCILGVIHDVTDQRKLEREAAHLASFPTLNTNPVIEIGTDGTVRYANAAAMNALARLGLKPDARQFLPGTPEELVRLWSECVRKPLSQEFPLGEATFIRDVNAPGEDALRVYAVDISKRVQLEKEVRTLNDDLDLRVRQRTAELTAANKELEAFSYSVSHDLRTPLRSIDGFSHAFLEDYGDAIPVEGRAYLERIRAAAQNMGQIIEDMLLLSQITRSHLHMQATDISALASEIARELSADNPRRDVQWNIEPGMTAICDQHLLRVVFVNLVGNAWKFTSKRTCAHIDIGTVRDTEHGSAFFVRDDGAGFDGKYKEKLFVAFQRLHDQREYPGTGVGLATVQRAVRRHGGDVWATGEVDRGATFFFTIPLLHTPTSSKEKQE